MTPQSLEGFFFAVQMLFNGVFLECKGGGAPSSVRGGWNITFKHPGVVGRNVLSFNFQSKDFFFFVK